jgi:uroporphyrinogen decarboxylase
VCLWRHWQGDDQRTADFVRATLGFQMTFDWDMVVLAPSPHFCLTGYGLADTYDGNVSGERTITKYPIKSSLDWTEIRPLDPNRGDLHKQTEAVRLLCEALNPDETPIIPVVYSPLSQAIRLAGSEVVLRHLRTQPERLHSGLTALTDTTVRFLDAIRRFPIAGIYYVMDAAHHELLAETEYAAFGLHYDQKVLTILPSRWWCNIAYVGGTSPMLPLVGNLPVQGFNWQSHTGNMDLEKARGLVRGALFGGLGKRTHLQGSTPTSISDTIRNLLNVGGGRRVIIGCDGAMLVTTPQSNMLAVRETVQSLVR